MRGECLIVIDIICARVDAPRERLVAERFVAASFVINTDSATERTEALSDRLELKGGLAEKSGSRLNGQGRPCVRYASRRHLDRVGILYICRSELIIFCMALRTIRISQLVQWFTNLGF